MELSFCELRTKEVINVIDGRRLGRVVDLIFKCQKGQICGIVASGERCGSFFKKGEELYIPWCDICKIGNDVIIVELKCEDRRKEVCKPNDRFSSHKKDCCDLRKVDKDDDCGEKFHKKGFGKDDDCDKKDFNFKFDKFDFDD